MPRGFADERANRCLPSTSSRSSTKRAITAAAGHHAHRRHPARSSASLGTNGAGKSTLLRAISGFHGP